MALARAGAVAPFKFVRSTTRTCTWTTHSLVFDIFNSVQVCVYVYAYTRVHVRVLAFMIMNCNIN